MQCVESEVTPSIWGTASPASVKGGGGRGPAVGGTPAHAQAEREVGLLCRSPTGEDGWLPCG